MQTFVSDPATDLLITQSIVLLVLVAACQDGAVVLAAATARWLVRAPWHAGLLGAAGTLARVMDRAGLRLRPPASLGWAGT